MLPIAGAELILGAAWLATLGLYLVDYSTLTLQFIQDNRFVILRGETPPPLQHSSIHQLHRLCLTKAIAQCFTLTWQEVRSSPNTTTPQEQGTKSCIPALIFPAEMPPDLRQVLQQYHPIFTVPVGLSPTRPCDHRIPLMPTAPPVKVRPYRYPHSQKTEIEEMVSHMLAEGLIEPSTSPFSSPVIFVKKRMGHGVFAQTTEH